MRNEVPQSAASAKVAKMPKIAGAIPNYTGSYPCWRIGRIDEGGDWGLMPLMADFEFAYTDEIRNVVVSRQHYKKLDEVLRKMDGKVYRDVPSFWERLHKLYTYKIIPTDIHGMIQTELSETSFMRYILPKLRDFEKTTWDTINKQTHDDGKSSNHYVDSKDFCKRAQDRLSALKLDDAELYSLRIDNKKRLYGIRNMNYFEIIWIDFNHSVYPVQKKHT